MTLNIYVKQDCDFCKQLEIPQGLNINMVDVGAIDYNGFRPQQIPVLQLGDLNLEGPQVINPILNLLANADSFKG